MSIPMFGMLATEIVESYFMLIITAIQYLIIKIIT